jgi:predicted house-cleaning noncanonical NTP pyrophosphatase (MazG superfamily)
MRKLIRDKMWLTPERAPSGHSVSRCRPDQYRELLFEKLNEECLELRDAVTLASSPTGFGGRDQRVLEEAADVLEVACAIASDQGFNLQDVLLAADNKRFARGGFDSGTVLEG